MKQIAVRSGGKVERLLATIIQILLKQELLLMAGTALSVVGDPGARRVVAGSYGEPERRCLLLLPCTFSFRHPRVAKDNSSLLSP
jgi:hypothetical protein